MSYSEQFTLHKPDVLPIDSYFTDIAVIRPPDGIQPAKVSDLSKRLNSKGFLILCLPTKGDDFEERWHPTDRFREVGDFIFNNGYERELENSLTFIQSQMGDSFDFNGIRRRVIPVNRSFVGGFYIYLSQPHNIFMYSFSNYPNLEKDYSKYAETLLPSRLQAQREIAWALSLLSNDGWRLFQFPQKEFKEMISLPHKFMRAKKVRYLKADFDSLISLFYGNDGLPHAIVAKSFMDEVRVITQDSVVLHQISDKEAGIGNGCNIADLRNGQVLIPPNRKDAPTTFKILSRCAAAEIVEAPPTFFDYTSGPRCNIASFKL